MKVIKLAGQEFNIVAPSFGNLRKVISSINKMQSFTKDAEEGTISEEAMEEVAFILSVMTKKTLSEIDEMPIGIAEMSEALKIIPDVCGLESVKKEADLGEVKA